LILAWLQYCASVTLNAESFGLVGASAAVGAFLVGLTLTGAIANRARAVLAPLCWR